MIPFPKLLLTAAVSWCCVGSLLDAQSAPALESLSSTPPIATSASRDEAAPHVADYVLSTLSIDAGLPHPSVTAALQTHDGYLWVGTQGGLARFDGVRFAVFQPSNTSGPTSSAVRCLAEDAKGNLWIGTEHGVFRRQAGHFDAMGLADVSISALAVDHAGRVWIGTIGQGVQVWDGRLRRVDPENGSPTQAVRCLYVDARDRVWIGCQSAGLFYADHDDTIQQLPDARGVLEATEVDSICEQPRGVLWVGSHRRGLFRLTGNELVSVIPGERWADSSVTCLAPARDGGLWIVAGSVHKISVGERIQLDPTVPKVEPDIFALCEDHEGNLWLCGKNDGLIRARPLSYRMISAKNGLNGSAVKSVAEDLAGNWWLTVQHGGVNRVGRDGSVTVFNERQGFPSAESGMICAARDGSVWFSANSLYRWKDGVCQSYPELHPIHGLFEDRDGVIWLGTGAGVLRFEHDRFESVQAGPDRPILYASSFAEDAKGAMYIGSWNLGLFKVQGSHVQVFNHANGLPTDSVRAVHVDHEGRVWVGMKTRGLAVFENGHWLNPGTIAEAVGGHVFAIAEDDANQLWLGTSLGIMWAPKPELLAVARGEKAAPKFRVAGANNEFDVAPAWPGGQPNAAVTSDHRLLFATARGLVVMDPEHLTTNQAPPLVHVERVLLDQHEVAAIDGLVAPAGTRGVTIEYTALSFAQPSRVFFKYRLEGYDQDWIDAGTQRVITYRSLRADHYVFRVKACNNDGVWNETGATFAFSIEPFLWQRWWFLAGVIAVSTFLIVAAVRYVSFRRLRLKLRELERQTAVQRERARIARDIHDDVGNRLTELSLLSGLALRDHHEVERTEGYVRQISSAVRQVTDSLDEIIWAVSPRNDKLPSVIHYIAEFAVEFLQNADVQCSLDLPDDVPPREVPAEIRHNFFLAVKEALTNAVRHSGTPRVRLEVLVTAEQLQMTVQDFGRGFAAEPDRDTADGLRNMRQRMEEIGGTFQLESKVGAGTTVSFRYHWPRAK